MSDLGPLDVDKWLAEHETQWPSKWTPKQVVKQGKQQGRNGRSYLPVEQATRWIAKTPGAISGSKGHATTFYVACSLIQGFNLSIDDARGVFAAWNETCQPPWTAQELEHKLEEAERKPSDQPAGWKLRKQEPVRRKKRRSSSSVVADPPSPDSAEGGDPKEGIVGEDDGLSEDDGSYDEDTEDTRIEIEAKIENIVNKESIKVLSEDSSIFTRGGILVEDLRPLDISNIDDSQIKRKKNSLGSVNIRQMSMPKIRHFLDKNIAYYKMVAVQGEDGEIEYKKKYIAPPEYCVKAIHGWGDYPDFNYLNGISEIPILKSNGHIVYRSGYDTETQMIYHSDLEFPFLGSNLTRDDATKSAERLFDLVGDFPFQPIDNDKGATHKATWLAGLLTVSFRHLIDDICPMFVFPANVSSAGKTKLADIIGMIVSGRKMTRSSYYTDNIEMDKRILAIALEATPFVLFDNVENSGTVGGPALDLAITSRTYKGRLLGHSKMSDDMPMNTTFFATGNDISVKGDTLRRVMIARIESKEEKPEARDDYRIKEILEYVDKNRVSFVVDILTIMKSFILAGKPKDKSLVRMDFNAWSNIIRESIYWSTGIDVLKSQYHLRSIDRDSLERLSIIEGWSELENSDRGLTIAEAVQRLDSAPEKYKTLRSALLGISRAKDNKLPPNNIIGNKISRMKDINIKGRYIHGERFEGTMRWSIHNVKDENKEDGSDGVSRDQDSKDEVNSEAPF